MNNNLNFMFGMYEPTTDSVIVNIDENSVLVIRCKACNSSVIFEEPNDIEYSRAVTPQIRQAGNRLSGLAETAYASLLA